MQESASANEGGSLVHLKAAALATGAVLFLAVSGSQYARLEIRRHIDALAQVRVCMASRIRWSMNQPVFWVTPSARANS